jgi:hypothetical protein
VRCPRCGNENSEQNRFCGMCGATLLSVPEPVAKQPQSLAAAKSASSSADAPASRPQVVDTLRSSAPADDAPGISGPSFLGLNDPPSRKRTGLSIDPHETANSRNLEYLLDDDDEPKNSGAGKFVVILVALALAVGLGYLRWKNHGFGWLNLSSKPSAAAQNTDDNSSSATTPDSQPAATTPAITPAPTQPAKTPAASNTNPPATATSATPSTQPPTSPSTPAATDAPKPADATPPAATEDKPATPAPNESAPAPKQPSSDDSDADASDQPKPTADQPPAKPVATIKPTDPVTEAQKYLYGRSGVTQNCDRGLRLLKGPANQGNSKAMVEMGALYSAGLCTPRDLPTAYRWFALALRKDPDNQSVQADLQKLWGEMTQPERKLAIQLTQ